MQILGSSRREGYQEYWYAVDLVNYRGHFQAINPLAVTGVWQDEKMLIEATVNLEDKRITNIRIGLKMIFRFEDEAIEPLVPFPPAIETDDKRRRYTIVYDGGNFPHYFRPGRWQKHLQNVIKDLKEKSNKFLDLHNKAVDDSALFSDISDNADEEDNS